MNRKKLWVFDFDGCLYPFPENVREFFDEQAGELGTLVSEGQLSRDDAIRLIRNEYFSGGLGIEALSQRFNKSVREVHILHHNLIHMDLKPDPRVVDFFKTIDRSQIFPIILTHASRCFLDRKLPMLGLKEAFPHSARVALEDYGFSPDRIHMKSTSLRGFMTAKFYAESITGWQFNPEDITMFEDTDHNLRNAKLLGWNTAHVNHGKTPANPVLHADQHLQTVADFSYSP